MLEHDPDGAWRPTRSPSARASASERVAGEVTGGRTLALFTNKRDMHRVAAAVGAHVEDDGVLVLAQGLPGAGAPRLAEESARRRDDPARGGHAVRPDRTSPATRSPAW